MSRHPSVKWAQRSDKIYITIELPDASDVKLKLEPAGKFFFSAVKDGNPYEVDIELLDKVNVEESKYNIGVRHIVYVIQKAEKKWWSRLIKQDGKPPVFLKVDWDKWVDEDEENESHLDYDDMDFSKNQRKVKRRKKKNLWQQLKRVTQRKNPLNQWLKRLRLDCIKR
ncbi:co-chaperone protein p23-1-like isoform X2 [Amaranthus tricolor]|uniref:co-chaperone protein p23-1-like isoform X2 n=1 Tax=Amaranthus tricolor TaxID=29722 RepID=UPI002585ABF7|nr:co-chaperone protein p23-1-like isoform X2 [Amaranthus tricolor]